MLQSWKNVLVSPTGKIPLENKSKDRTNTDVFNSAGKHPGQNAHDCWWQIGKPHGDGSISFSIAKTNNLKEVILSVQDDIDPLIN